MGNQNDLVIVFVTSVLTLTLRFKMELHQIQPRAEEELSGSSALWILEIRHRKWNMDLGHKSLDIRE